jgi:hypothetical protein
MTRSKLQILALAGCGLLLLPVLGCAFAADLINPDFLRQVGFDPATIVPPAGKVLVAFTNDTSASATFYAYYTEASLEGVVLTGGNLTSLVDAGTTRSEAVDCPFETTAPGRLGGGAADTTAAIVNDPAGQVVVAYAGTPLVMGLDFVCGDLIEIQLIQTGAGTGQDDGDAAQGQYDLRVQVHPGR